MVLNPYQQYQNNSVNTASKEELTLMLYNGAIKFCNIAIEAIENKNVPRAHENIVKVENIIMELRVTLNKKYPIAQEMDKLYEYIYWILTEANMKKDKAKVEEACNLIRIYRDAWQEAMKIAKKR